MLQGTKIKVEKVEPNSLSDGSFTFFVLFFVLRCFMNIFKSGLWLLIPALQGAQLGMHKQILFSDRSCLAISAKQVPPVVLWAQHPCRPLPPKKHLKYPKSFINFTDYFIQITRTGHAWILDERKLRWAGKLFPKDYILSDTMSQQPP